MKLGFCLFLASFLMLATAPIAVVAAPVGTPAAGPMTGPPPENGPMPPRENLMQRLAGQWRISEPKPELRGNLIVNYIVILRPDGTFNIFLDMSGVKEFPIQVWGTYTAAAKSDGAIALRLQTAGTRPEKVCDPLGVLSGHDAACTSMSFSKNMELTVKLKDDGTMESVGAFWQRTPLP